jgi:hypothetical protein
LCSSHSGSRATASAGCPAPARSARRIRIRVERRFHLSRGRFTAALLFLVLLPIATMMPALAGLALVLAVWLGLHAYELIWWREARAESRSTVTSS